MAASQASLRPPKGILKNKGSTTSSMVAPSELQPELLPSRSGDEPRKKSQRWDEVSILATYHPADKDYGLMDMDEASTLYHRMGGDDEDAMRDFEAAQALTPDALANKSAAAEGSELKIRVHGQDSSNEDFSPEKQERKRQFEMKRKLHSNEGLNIKLGRQLSSKNLNSDEEDEEMSETAAGENMDMKESNQGSTSGDQLQTKSQSS
ncbi:protein phosphatase inhibitor 2-like isoform X2 [Sturnira hondurensis]|uniref:protein phosphatase inhibitor 2-like isoform X2 n=1 Tax=Sturnira hondurensis TaxID=192404 RepID=UPI00187AEA79|nr:protein phosphatase inhibitor 2-like isoform X2 [Sturnira hondurensis]